MGDGTTSLHDFFKDAEIIHSYSRAEAIEDGFLVDVTETAKEAGISFHTAMTRTVFDKYVAVPKGVRMQDEKGRLWDICWMLAWACRKASANQSVIWFRLHVRNDNRDRTPPEITLKAVCSPGDTMAPVITIMLRDED